MCLNFCRKFVSVLRTPAAFFARAKKEQGVLPAFTYDAILSLIPTAIIALAFLFTPATPDIETSAMLPLFSAVIIVFVVTSVYVLSLASGFVSAGILHLFALLLGARNSYAATYKAMIYSSTPGVFASLFLLALPTFQQNAAGAAAMTGGMFVFGIWSFYLQVKGLSVLHNMSMKRAAAVILIPVAIALAIVAAFISTFVVLLLPSMAPFLNTTIPAGVL